MATGRDKNQANAAPCPVGEITELQMRPAKVYALGAWYISQSLRFKSGKDRWSFSSDWLERGYQPNPQGSSVKTQVSKAESEQGSKRQVGKDVTLMRNGSGNVLGQVMFLRLCWNFQGFLHGSRA